MARTIESPRNTPETLERYKQLLLDQSIGEDGKPRITPLHVKFRVVFQLKALRSDEAVQVLASGFRLQSDLLKHELAYVLGQMGLPSASPILKDLLQSTEQSTIVRHEAAEALGALGDKSALPVLQRLRDDPQVAQAIRETCELSIESIQSETAKKSKFGSVDPAPALDSATDGVEGLRRTLLDENASLWTRYRAMFALRDDGSDAAIDALGEAFNEPKSSLFRHEIAFIFGQMSNPHSVPYLIKQLKKEDEEPMVRHECAEALGGIGTPECRPVLERYNSTDAPPVVRESCRVALDMLESANDHLQFYLAEWDV